MTPCWDLHDNSEVQFKIKSPVCFATMIYLLTWTINLLYKPNSPQFKKKKFSLGLVYNNFKTHILEEPELADMEPKPKPAKFGFEKPKLASAHSMSWPAKSGPMSDS